MKAEGQFTPMPLYIMFLGIRFLCIVYCFLDVDRPRITHISSRAKKEGGKKPQLTSNGPHSALVSK